MSARADSAGVVLRSEIPPELAVTVERGRMRRVFMNLFANAMDAMPGGGTITIHASSADGFALVEVQDEGGGIAPAVRDRLFEPFASLKRNGMGLGLALARQSVADNGGEMWSDDMVERGARFCLKLPAAQAPSTVTTQGGYDCGNPAVLEPDAGTQGS